MEVGVSIYNCRVALLKAVESGLGQEECRNVYLSTAFNDIAMSMLVGNTGRRIKYDSVVRALKKAGVSGIDVVNPDVVDESYAPFVTYVINVSMENVSFRLLVPASGRLMNEATIMYGQSFSYDFTYCRASDVATFLVRADEVYMRLCDGYDEMLRECQKLALSRKMGRTAVESYVKVRLKGTGVLYAIDEDMEDPERLVVSLKLGESSSIAVREKVEMASFKSQLDALISESVAAHDALLSLKLHAEIVHSYGLGKFKLSL